MATTSSAGAVRAGRAYIELFVRDGKLVQGLRNAGARLRAMGASLKAVGQEIFTTGLGAAVPFGLGAKAFADFEAQMALVSTMLEKPDQHMARFTKGVQDMAVEFGEGTETIADALREIIGSAIAPEHALDVLRVALMAARAGAADTATTTNALINVLNAFGASANQAGDVADVLFKTVERGVITFPELANHLGITTSSAKAAGLSYAEMGAALATMTRNGLKADLATTSLNNIMGEILKPSKESADLQRELGLNLSRTRIEATGFLSVLEDLAKLPPETLARLFPDIRGLRGILAMRGDMAGLRKDIELMGTRGGATMAAFGKVSGTLRMALGSLKQSLVAIGVEVGEALAPSIKAAAEWIKKALPQIRQFIKENKGWVQIAAAAVVATLTVGVALFGLGVALRAIGATLGVGAFLFNAFLIAISKAASIARFAGRAFLAVSNFLGTLSFPIFSLIAAVTGLAAYFVASSGTIETAVNGLSTYFKNLKTDAETAFGGIAAALAKGDIALAARILWTTLQLEWTAGVAVLNATWQQFKAFFLQVINEAITSAAALFTDMWAGLQVGWVEVVESLRQVWATFTGWFVQIWNNIVTFLAKVITKITGWVTGATDEAADQIRTLDEDHQRNQANAAKQTAADKAAIEERRQARRAQIEADRQGAQNVLADDHERATKSIWDTRNEAIERDRAEVAKLRGQLGKLAADAKAEPERGNTHQRSGDDADGKRKDLITPVADAERKFSVAGTFNPFAAAGLGTGGPAEETAKNTRKMAGILEQMQKKKQPLAGNNFA